MRGREVRAVVLLALVIDQPHRPRPGRAPERSERVTAISISIPGHVTAAFQSLDPVLPSGSRIEWEAGVNPASRTALFYPLHYSM